MRSGRRPCFHAVAQRLSGYLEIEQTHFVGISMGGMIGQCLALNHPDRLRSLALCDTASVVPSEAQPVWQERLDQVRKKGMEALLEETLERWFTPAFLRQAPPMVKLIREQILATPVAGYMGCAEAIRRLNYLDRISGIKTPTLIIVGEDDPDVHHHGLEDHRRDRRAALTPGPLRRRRAGPCPRGRQLRRRGRSLPAPGGSGGIGRTRVGHCR